MEIENQKVVTNPTSNSNQASTNTAPDESFLKISLVNQYISLKRKKACPLKPVPDKYIDYKTVSLLSKFISERGRIYPSRVTGTSKKKQSLLSAAIKRARALALISPIKKI